MGGWEGGREGEGRTEGHSPVTVEQAKRWQPVVRTTSSRECLMTRPSPETTKLWQTILSDCSQSVDTDNVRVTPLIKYIWTTQSCEDEMSPFRWTIPVSITVIDYTYHYVCSTDTFLDDNLANHTNLYFKFIVRFCRYLFFMWMLQYWLIWSATHTHAHTHARTHADRQTDTEIDVVSLTVFT